MAEQLVRWEDDGVVVEALPGVGGRLHRVRAFGVDLLRTPPDTAAHRRDPFFWGAFPMAPWCNRATTEPVTLAGRRVALPANFPDGTAIHGQVYAAGWEVVDDATLRVEAGGGAWPWRYEVRARFRVAPAAWGLTLELRNRDDGPMPAGLGIHPWFVKPLHVAIPARRVLTDTTARAGEPRPVEPPFDLRRLDAMPDGLDATWTDLDAHAVELAWPAHGLRATFRFSESAAFVTAASPPDKDAVAVEPQTHAPYGERRLLAPGEALAVDYDVRVERAPASGRT